MGRLNFHFGSSAPLSSDAFLREQGRLDDEDGLPDGGFDMHPMWREIVETKPFKQFGAVVKRQRRRHINLNEISAALRAEKRQGDLEPSSFYIHLQDSQVSLACLVKGRSSSTEINRLLQRSIPDHVSSNVRPYYGYVRSKLNPADDPTRAASIRGVARASSGWLDSAIEGDFGPLDHELTKWGLNIRQLGNLPDERELLPDVVVDRRTSVQKKAERGKFLGQSRNAGGSGCKLVSASISSEPGQSAPAPISGGFCESESPAEKEQELSREHQEAGEPNKTAKRGTKTLKGPIQAVFPQSFGSRVAPPAVNQVAAKEEGPASEDLSALLDGESADWKAFLLSAFHKDQFVYSSRFRSVEEALDSGPGVLDLFSGARGFSRAFTRAHCSWSLCFDVKHRASEDLLDPWLQSVLMKLLHLGAFRAMAASPVCASFSTAITPPWRNLQYPGGRPDLSAEQKAKIDLGQQQLSFVKCLLEICILLEILFWVENPDGSWFWKQLPPLHWTSVVARNDVGFFRVDQCRYGTKWRKRTRFLTNSHLRHQRVLCRCDGPHTVLRGRCREKKMNYTKLAEAYPGALCSELSLAFGIDLRLNTRSRPLNVSDCARCSHSRIGEAKNPGPRRRGNAPRMPREGNLDDFDTLRPETVSMRRRFWAIFVEWLQQEMGEGALDSCLATPMLLAKALEIYGGIEFSAGTPLHYYRQLVAHTQREYPLVKPFIGVAWNVVTRWEVAEPIQHRPPLPEPLLESMAALALLWDWPVFAASILLCFYGICRIGEIMVAERSDLLTPQDLLSSAQVAYLRIRKPKSRGRGPKVQHATVRNEAIVSFICNVWQNLGRGEKLYPGSPATFRRRWDSLLDHIGVPALHRLTPGSLRAGGCVAAHKQGTQIQDLLWAMRLQHSKTLAYYLQEITAESILPALGARCRSNIVSLRSILPFLMKAVAQRTESFWFSWLSTFTSVGRASLVVAVAPHLKNLSLQS